MIINKPMVHLHLHTEYSELDGMGKIQEYVAKAIELGMPAIAVTDHGSSSGAYELFKECEDKPIKALLGTEFYLKTEYGRGHIVALAMNNKGWKNILKLQRYAFSDKGFDFKPCVDMKSLKKYNEGIIITSACIANPIGYLIGQDRGEEALEFAVKFQDIFGDRFYIELQSSATERQKKANQGLVRIAQKIGAEMVVTNDCHYVEKGDSFAHEVLLAIQTRSKMSDEERFRFDTDGYHMKSYEEMFEDVHVDKHIIERALQNTVEVAERCNATIERSLYLPKYHTIPTGHTSESLLKSKVTKGYAETITADGLHSQKYVDDVTSELKVICDEGYADYFLIVQDYIRYARRNGIIVGDGRGSAAGVKTSYVMDITRVNPEPYNLLFERFLSTGREPDIDTDFSDREKVIDYLIETYGAKNVAVVGSFNYLTTKAVIRKILSAFDHPSYYITSVTKPIDGLNDTLEDALRKSKPFVAHCKKHPEEWAVIQRLYGVISHVGVHAGGVLIYPNISELIPVRTLSANRDKQIAYLDKKMLEWLGHVKFDVLGLQSLAVMQGAVASIQADTGNYIDLHDIDYTDISVYNMLTTGDVSGVFQLSEQAHMLMEQKPTCFEDIIAINALIRPGVGDWNEYIARRRGKKYNLHPLRKPYLSETFGIICYQEQYELDCQTFAGWTIAFADKNVRKGYNLPENVELAQKFIDDGMKRGFSQELLVQIWDEIVFAASGGYSFCKAHATSYAILSYQAAWLKKHYPAHFYAALMTKEGSDQDEIANLLAEIKRRDIELMPPDINTSSDSFVARGKTVYYRLTSITQVGGAAIKAIENARPIKDIDDLIAKTTRRDVRTNVIMNLIQAGCFDFQNPNRFNLLNSAQEALGVDVEQYGEWNNVEKAVMEKKSLGIYLTEHPLDRYHYKPFYEVENNTQAIIAGEVADISEIKDKSGNTMAFITLSNQYGNVKCLVFASSWRGKMKETFMSKQFVAVVGKKSGTSLLIDKAKELTLDEKGT